MPNPTSPSLTRRGFLKTSAESAASLTALPAVLSWASTATAAGANDRVRIGVCGLRKRGFDHVRLFSQIPNVVVAAVCEVDENVLREAERGYRAPFVIPDQV